MGLYNKGTLTITVENRTYNNGTLTIALENGPLTSHISWESYLTLKKGGY